MGAEIRIYEIGDSWALMPSAHGSFVNNGNVDLYIQQQKGDAPGATDAGVRIRPGGSFFVSHELYKSTYLRTISGTTTIANYEDKNSGAGSTALIDPASGNHAMINETGQVHVVLRGDVDINNSTNTPLAENEVFTGEPTETLDYAVVNISVFADAPSAIDGLSIEQSCDGIHWDIDDKYTIQANTGKTFSIQTACKYYRIVYTNSATAQTAFRLASLLKKGNTKPSSHRIADPIISDDDAELVKSVITGLRPDGTFGNAVLDNTNRQQVVSQDYLYGVAKNTIPNHTTWQKVGFTPTMTTAVSDIWSLGGLMNRPPTGGIQMEVVSSSAADDTGGTGARTVRIYYLDATWTEKTETVTLDGTNPVDTVATDIFRVNGFRVITTGTALAPVGNISLRNTAGTVTYSYITAGFTRARNSAFTVPVGKVLYITNFVVSFGYASNSTHYCRLFTRATQNEGVYVPDIFYPFTEVVCANSSQQVILQAPTKLMSKVDIKVSGISTFSGVASVGLGGWIESI